MENKSHLSKLIARLDRIKAAADGAETSMPDDPSGDGTTEPKTGPQFTQYSKDKAQIETVPPDADEQPSSSMTEDHEQDNSFSSYTLSTAGSEAQSAKGEYTDRPTDPGTSMPAEAGQEKYSSANDCSLEENIDVFNKCAACLISGAQQYDAQVKQAAAAVQQYSQYPLGYFTKMAEDMGASPEEANEIAAIEAIVQEQPELLDELADMSPEELDELQAIAEVIDNEAAAQATGDAEAAELEKESFFRQEPVIQQTLASLNDGQLKQAAANLDVLLQKAAADELSEDEIAAILEDASSDEASDEEPAESVSEDIPEEATDGEEKEGCGGKCRRKKASAQELYYMAMLKQAEEDQEAYESLSPEEQALLNSASDEELQQALAEGDAVSQDPASIEDLLAEGSDDASEAEPAPEEDSEPTSEEAMSELAAAMDEQGITPEVLEEASKEASADPELYKIAQAVTQYRRSGKYVYHPATTEKAAKMRSISHRYLSEIFPHK